jgi:hypothetical protein
MTRYNHIEKVANLFYCIAYDEKEAQFAYFFNSLMKRIARLAEGCIASSQHLLSYQQYSNSEGLKNISIQMPKVMNIARAASVDYAKQSADSISNLVGGLTFYTRSSGAGMGKDSLTNQSVDNVTPPSYYVNTINILINKIQSKLKERKSEQESNS